MSDKLAAWNYIYPDITRAISTVEGMLLSNQFDDKEALEHALINLVDARDCLIIACSNDKVAN